jgi:hypothetical protein
LKLGEFLPYLDFKSFVWVKNGEISPQEKNPLQFTYSKRVVDICLLFFMFSIFFALSEGLRFSKLAR